MFGCRYELLDSVSPNRRSGAAEVAKETLEAVMGTLARILPSEAARLAPPLSKVPHDSFTQPF